MDRHSRDIHPDNADKIDRFSGQEDMETDTYEKTKITRMDKGFNLG